jgi:cytochrome b6-f complex iron-sulfur subunit/menaquinol-cytochrome c reductase iron-sulfur subunit
MSTKENGDAGARSDAAPAEGRRGALGLLLGLGTVAYAGALVVPACGYLAGSAAAADGKERWTRVAKLTQLAEGVAERVKVLGEQRDAFTVSSGQTLGSVWLVRAGDTVRALSAECPHLGCAIDKSGDGTAFACPCHTSRFTLDGKAEGGPSPRAMDEIAARVVDGFVEVDFRRFRQGIPDKVEVG